MKTRSRRWLRVVGLVLAALLLALAGGYRWFAYGSPAQAEHRPYPLPPQRGWTWDAWLAEGRDVALCTIQTGSVRVSRASMLRRDHRDSDLAHEADPLPVFAHLISHPVAGDVLVDTGVDASFARDPLGNLRAPARLVHRALGSAFVLAPGEDIAAQLARRGARPTIAFFTHLHGDHTAGVPALPPSMRLAVGAGELDDVASHLGYGHVGASRMIEEVHFTAGAAFGPFAHVADLFGDGSVLAIPTPGHTTGHTSYLVHARSGPVLLVGDASHTAWAFAHDVGPRGPTSDEEALGQRSLELLRAFAAAHPEVHLTFGHEDPAPRCDAER